MGDKTITQTLPCPACGHLIRPDVGLKIPSLPEAVWCTCRTCAQPLVLTLMRDERGSWEVRAFKVTPTSKEGR